MSQPDETPIAAPVDYWPCGCVKGETPHGAGWADCEYVKQGQTPADPELFARAQGRLGRSAASVHRSGSDVVTVTYDDPVAAYASLRRELATIFGPVQPRKGQTWNEAMLARITERLVADGK